MPTGDLGPAGASFSAFGEVPDGTLRAIDVADLDGNGVRDIAIGAPRTDTTLSAVGRVWLVTP